LNAFSCHVPQEKCTPFFVNSFSGAAMVLKSFIKQR
jgi:nitrate reductase cytochrome c-type subunit